MYNFDLIYIIYMLLPPLLRNPVLVYFIASLLEPVRTLHEQFASLQSNLHYYQSSTGQVIYLRHMLRDQFGGNEISIVDGTPDEGAYLGHYPVSDAKLAHYGSESSYLRHINDSITVDFIVRVPAVIYDDLSDAEFDRMNAIIERYKLIDRIYKIDRV